MVPGRKSASDDAERGRGRSTVGDADGGKTGSPQAPQKRLSTGSERAQLGQLLSADTGRSLAPAARGKEPVAASSLLRENADQMRKNMVFAVAAAAAGLGAVLTAIPGPSAARTRRSSGIEAAGEPAPPDEWLLSMRLSGDAITPAHLRRASEQAERIGRETEAAMPSLGQIGWTFEGPAVIGGRIVDLAVDPQLPSTVYAAAASGGVWKSTDAGGTFSSAWPTGLTQAVGALAVTPAGRLYAGAGESNPGGGSVSFGGKGVYASSDGGGTWTSLGLDGTERISRIAVDPVNEARVFVAATGPLFTPGGDRGVYRSDDAGQTWTRVLRGANKTTGASDVQVHPLDHNRVYAVTWDHLRVPDYRRYGGPGSGIHRSTDGGSTWQRLAGGLPPPGPDVGRIGLGLASTDLNRLYAIYIDASGNFSGFFTSADGGDTWTQLPNNGTLSGSQSTYGWWFARIWVDPANALRVFVAGVPLVVSTNGGSTWTQQGGVHADQHAMAWDPNVPGRVYLGNDGGIYRSLANGLPPWTFATVQPFTQFYSIDVGEQDATRIVGGAQDNGCNRSYSTGNPSNWNTYSCADGLEALISFANQQVVYGCSQYGSCVRSVNGGDSSSSIGGTTSQRRNWLTPLVFDPTDANVMYYAGNIVNRSTNGGQTWSAISPDLTGGDPHPEDAYPFGTVTTVAAAKSNPLALYAGTDDGRIWHTTSGGPPWIQAVDPNLPDRWVTRIVVDPADANVAYATFSGFRNADYAAYVLKTTDGGVSWTDVTGYLPQGPVNVLALAGTRVVVGTDVGVFVNYDGGAWWYRVGRGLPRSPIMDLRFHAPTNGLFAATFGRGMWRLQLPASFDARR